jgi:signal transduction histidine kinase/phage shock protein PspC (stress-responsive transcriptional regulator)
VSEAVPQPPLRRDPSHGLIAGVCAGLAGRLGVDATVVRFCWVATLAAGGVGLPLYVLAWLMVPADGPERPFVQRLLSSRRDAWLVAGGLACLALAALLLLREWGLWLGDRWFWPVVLAAGGGALIWRQSNSPAADEAPRETPARSVLRLPRPAAGRAAVGAALVVGGALVFLALNRDLAPARDVIAPVVVILIAAALILAPWWLRLVRGLAAERAERVRSQERAELAAHLHDSVLQTLALMQKRADDPREVAALARRQERELRAWLNGRRPDEASLAAALEAAAQEVEDDHGVPVEVVTVGDGPLDERGAALVAAAREALVNAAKFAGPEPISLYAEVEGERVEVFVRDRGPGFDPGAVPADRRGLRESIVGRMERHGGRATLHTVPGQGTEVELVMEK